MYLQGSLHEFSLPNVLQLVKMSAKTGVLTLRRDLESGRLYFRGGHVYYATLDPQVVPLGRRLVRSGRLTEEQLAAALRQQQGSAEPARIGSILVAQGALDRGTLVEAVADQIEEAAFSLLGWTEGEFEFVAGGPTADEDIIVELTVDGVIMDGVRRLDEWDVIIDSLGSLQHVPRLAYDEEALAGGGVALSAEDWRVASCIDGRRDIGSVIRECGLNRFAAAKALYRLHASGLVEMHTASIQALGEATAVVLRSPIDFYSEAFLTALNDETLTRHLLMEEVGDEQVEVPMSAVTLSGEGEENGRETLVISMAAGVREDAWRQLASRCAACILLVNANSIESARASVQDLGQARAVEHLPFVVATYVSISEEALSVAEVATALGLDEAAPIIACELRDRRAAHAVVELALRQPLP